MPSSGCLLPDYEKRVLETKKWTKIISILYIHRKYATARRSLVINENNKW